jgi:hypothetical protein
MGLTFLTPWLLGGTVLIAAPIVLHLLMRKQPKPFDFPALRFVKQRQHTNRRSLNLRHLLLLAARCLLIALLALALARPSLQSSGLLGNADTPVAAVFLFESSPRLEYKHENKTRIEAAREIADWLLTQLPPESDVSIMETSRIVGDYAPDLLVAKQRIESLKVHPNQQPLIDVIESSLQLLRSNTNKERRELYLFTDLAKSSWPERNAERLAELQKKYAEVSLYLIDVGAQDPRNTSLGDLRLSQELLGSKGTLSLEVPIERVGSEQKVEATLYLLDANGTPIKKGQALRDLTPGQPDLLTFKLTDLPNGTQQGLIRLQQEDPLAADNVRYFTVETRSARPILIVAPEPANSYALLLEQALDPTPLRATGQSPFRVQILPQSKLARQELSDYAAVCLLDPLPIEPAVADKLKDYVKSGKGLAIWLGHNATLTGMNQPPGRDLLPGALELQWSATDRLYIAPEDLQHPIMQPFQGSETANPWIDFPVKRLWKFSKFDTGVNVILRLNNRLPLLTERPLGRGTILVMTTPVSESANDPDSWNQIATGFQPWPFQLLSISMLRYLTGNTSERFNYVAGEEITLQIPEADRGFSYTLTNPVDDLLTPSVDQVTGNLRTMSSEFAGHYRLRAGGSENGVRRGYSINIPANNTNLARLERTELDRQLSGGPFRVARTKDEIDRTVSTGRTGTELFPLLMLLLAALLGAEYFLSTKFYRQPVEEKETKGASLAGFDTRDKNTTTAPVAANSTATTTASAWPTKQQAPPQSTSGWKQRARPGERT